jgi:hypothetical protein
MFWCMFVSDITAIYRDILQCLTGAQTFHSLYVMRICALTCSLLQQSMQRTQNPPRATSWGFDPPSRHQDNKRLNSLKAAPGERFLHCR